MSLCLCLTLPGVGQAAAGEDVQQDLLQAIKAEIKAQKKANQWSQEKEHLVNRMRQLKTQLAWTRYQNDKYAAYIKQQKQKNAQLQQQQQRIKVLRQHLEPYLEEVLQRLRSQVEQGQPFLLSKRQQRLTEVQATLDDYEAGMADKLQKVLSALQAEAAYGSSVSVHNRMLPIQGQKMQVQVLRLGRITRFYRSRDGQHVGRWHGPTQQWQILPQRYNLPLKQAMRMARDQEAMELVTLPVGGYKD